MLDYNDVDALVDEIRQGEDLRDRRLEKLTHLIRMLTGGAFVGDTMCDTVVENSVFEYLSAMVPVISYEQPQARVRSRKETSEEALEVLEAALGQQVALGMLDPMVAEQLYNAAQDTQDTARAMQHGLQRWIVDSDYHVILDRLAFDYLLAYGVAVTRMGVMPGEDQTDPDSRRWPVVERISQYRFVMDPASLNESEASWKGHYSVESRQGLMDRALMEEGWRREAIKGLADMDQTDNDEAPTDSGGVDVHHRDLVKMYQMWLRDAVTEESNEDTHGVFVTIGLVQDPQRGDHYAMIRDPQAAYVGPKGPYTVFGAYVEPDSPWPISPLLATWSQILELNACAVSLNRNAQQYKRMVVVGSRDPGLAEAVASTPDMYVHTTGENRFDKDSVVELEIGGVTDQQTTHLAMYRDRVNRATGLDEAQRGVATGNKTATETAIADANATMRTSYLKKRFADAAEENLDDVSRMLYQEDRVEMPLGPEASSELGMVQPVFRGGAEDGQRYEDLELEIDVQSMGRSNEMLEQKRMQDLLEILGKLAPVMPETPHVDWKKALQMWGDRFNDPSVGELIDDRALEMAGMMMMQPPAPAGAPGEEGGVEPPMEQNGGSTPRRGRPLGGLAPQAMTQGSLAGAGTRAV